jgi:hypothetical protein
MPNASDVNIPHTKRILMAGRTGTGKTMQIWTLPGKRFAYIFDPNSLSSLVAQPPYREKGCNLDYELFLPEISDVDTSLKGFNKGSKDDNTRKRKVEPQLYNRWEADVLGRNFSGYDWLIIDSMTFLVKSIMDRQLYINNRYGGTEEIADYKVVGSKMAEVVGGLVASPLNIFCTAHLSVYQDEKTSKIQTELYLPGRARTILPLQFTDVFQAITRDDEKRGTVYEIRTKPDPKGLQDIRTSIPGLDTFEDVTIGRFDDKSSDYGIGALLSGKRRFPSVTRR